MNKPTESAAPSPATPEAEGGVVLICPSCETPFKTCGCERKILDDYKDGKLHVLRAIELLADRIGGAVASPPAAQEQKPVAELEVRNGIVSLKHTLAPIEQFYDGMKVYASPTPALGEGWQAVLIARRKEIQAKIETIKQHQSNNKASMHALQTKLNTIQECFNDLLEDAPKVTE